MTFIDSLGNRKHDTGWTERPIFGKVRYMNAEGLQRKYDMAAYLAKVQRQCKAAGTVVAPHALLMPVKAKKRKL
jgi:hypothetical protein